MNKRDIYWRTHKIQETLYIGQWRLSLFQRHLGTSHSSPNCHQLLRCIFLNLTDSLKSPLKGNEIAVFEKARSFRASNLGCRGHWVTWVIWCFTKILCRRCDAWVGVLSWWSCQSPVAHSCSLLNYLNSFHGGMFKLDSKFDADSLFYSLSHFEYDGHIVPMFTQQCLPPLLTSTVKSSLFVHAHSSPLSLARSHRCRPNHSCYINNGWTFSRQTSYTQRYGWVLV